MNEVTVAVLLTVFNRKDITISGLKSLYRAIKKLPSEYIFDIYMTQDGCTDGTPEAVSAEFPNVKIVKGDGTLYWGGGMNKAWEAALNSGSHYDYFLWFNDDVELYEDSLITMFSKISDDIIVTGAFRDTNGKITYGGKQKNSMLIEPNGTLQEVALMNGNLVVIPSKVYEKNGVIDKRLVHGGGDYEYSMRARSNGIRAYLSENYVGVCNRHDAKIPKYCSKQLSLPQRLKVLHSPMYNPQIHFYYNKIEYGILRACFNYAICYLGAFLPSVYSMLKRFW